ncbi:hypothetical protein KQI82_12480 [Oscillibacter sp. MSJ-2]|uniref:DUF3795 domain-containing protein n=1 Tax=Dysosmobacter acutus TaxID=2841504 RepID=A0ABS6FBT8_9FIRM|nr:hypothetical protein [Dysosmobacter acutus]MBU5627726.1 hypothetical protein [Dysosmobacter acutus]
MSAICNNCPGYAGCALNPDGKPCKRRRKELGYYPTNGDRIRAMSDEELAELLCTADWCEECDQLKEGGTCHAMELDGPLSKYCVAAGLKWLAQPAQEE